MAESPSNEAARHDPFAAWREPGFALYAFSALLSGTGQNLLQAAMAWQVYAISHSTFDLGLLGLVRFVPALGLSLVGGAAADAFNRRNVVIIAQSVPLACSTVLAMATFGDWVRLELIYALVLLIGLASAFEGPARASLLPSIVREEIFANAVTVATTIRTLAMISGPAIAGLIIAVAGVGAAYSVHVSLFVLAIGALSLLRYSPARVVRRGLSLTAIKEGVDFVRGRRLLIGIMALDMFAVIFGGATAFLPVYATDILHAGALGYGLLAASMQVGAFAMSVALIFRPPIERAGRTVVFMVLLYGAGTVAFGLSHIFALSLLFYLLIGAADQVSVVIRDTLVQLVTPGELRGRVSAVYLTFTGASNQLGAMESGFVAAATSATFAVVSGGFGALITAALIGWRLPELFHYRIPTAVNVVSSADSSPPAEG